MNGRTDDLFPEDAPSGGAPVSVMVPLPLEGPLDYLAHEPLAPGDFVLVPVSGRETVGVVWDAAPEDSGAKLKAVIRRLDIPPMPASMRRFLTRAARYTLTPPGMMLRLATRAPGLAAPKETRTVYSVGDAPPERMTEARRRVLEAARAAPGLSAGDLAEQAGVSTGVVRGLAEGGALEARSAPKDRPPPRLDPDHAPQALNPDQDQAAQAIAQALEAGRYETLLLKGVTGSGKTETYLEAVAETLRAGRQALILLPEIALTTDFIRRVEARFGAPPVAWHSGLSPAARRKGWKAVARGEAQVVAGARSALFLPFRDLALVVVDEEHEQSYKQEDQTLYQARDLSVLRAAEAGAVCVLASATPSLESWANAEAGKYRALDLPKRHGAAIMPFMQAIDLRADPPERGKWLSPVLVDAVAHALSAKEQALLFLNRRGYAPLTLCRKCGWRAGCDQCDAWLVEHRSRQSLQCHQCGWREPRPQKCPDCGAEALVPCGPGVERIAEEARETFPTARIVTLSSDLAADPAALQEQIAAVARGEADIVIGTQIVAKGHNFPHLTVVGVVDADLGLMGGDLRASERTFQILSQVSGRAGRASKPGRALLQTHQPEHPVLKAILEGDQERFMERLAEERRMAGAPPYGRYIAVIVQGEKEDRVWDAAKALAREAGPLVQAGVELLGPAPAPYAMLRGRHRVRFLLRMERSADHAGLIAAWRARTPVPSGVRAVFDVDAYSFL